MSEKLTDANWRNAYVLERYRGNRDFIVLNGLIDLATDLGYSVPESDLVQVPSAANEYYAIHQVTVQLEDGRRFRATGHADRTNVDNKMWKQIGHMAESRALARALRWATNCGLYTPEEAWEEEKDREGAQSAGGRAETPKPVEQPPQDPAPKTRESKQPPIQEFRTLPADDGKDAQVERLRASLRQLAEAESSSPLAVMSDYIRERGWKVTPQGLSKWPPTFKDDFEKEVVRRLNAPRVPA